MAKNTKGIVHAGNTTSKNYTYSKDDVKLDFTLRTDIRRQQKDFLELLERAVRDIKADLEVSKAV